MNYRHKLLNQQLEKAKENHSKNLAEIKQITQKLTYLINIKKPNWNAIKKEIEKLENIVDK